MNHLTTAQFQTLLLVLGCAVLTGFALWLALREPRRPV